MTCKLYLLYNRVSAHLTRYHEIAKANCNHKFKVRRDSEAHFNVEFVALITFSLARTA